MATLFSIAAPIFEGVFQSERTEIATAIAAGGTSLTVDNTSGFSANDYIILGEIGSELAEIVQISSVDSDTALTVGATDFAHSVNDPVTKTLVNQIKFYYASSSDGSYSSDATVDMDVSNPDLLTQHTTTLSDARDQFWKITYYNSTTANETSLDDAEPIQPSAETVYATVEELADFLGMSIGHEDRPLYDDALDSVRAATEMIDQLTNTSFKQTTYSNEVHDGNLSNSDGDYFVKHPPVVSVSSVSTTVADEGASSPTYNSLTVTDDYVVDNDTGRIRILDSGFIPQSGRADALKITYVGGRASVPSDIRRLCVLISSKQLMLATHSKNIIKGRKGVETPDINVIQPEIDRIVKLRRQGYVGKN